jgi:hypothetical protein
MRIGYWSESQKKRDHQGDKEVGEWTTLKWTLKRENGIGRIGLIWLRIGISGEHL